MIALVGNLSRDLIPGQPPRVGGGPFHGARALHRLRVPARIVARCAAHEREQLLPPVARLGTPVRYVPGESTATFAFHYEGDVRHMRIEAIGEKVMERLRHLDTVAYVRFASVYRQFQDVDQFMRELRGILDQHR